MTDSYRALCTDVYVNQKLALKMDLSRTRETILDLFDRIRREYPAMEQFRRYRDELALESDPEDGRYNWVAIRASSIRSGAVNPETNQEGYRLHRRLLEVAPYYLSISPLDVDYLELLWGFDLTAGGNHDEIVFEALAAGTPLGALLDIPGAVVTDCQPLLGVTIGQDQEIDVNFEVKTRGRKGADRSAGDGPGEPISIYLTLRRYGPVRDVTDLPGVLDVLVEHGERLVESRVIPKLVVPIRQAIASSS